MPANALRERVHQLMGRAEEDLRDLVAHRSVADARQYPVEECERAALLVARLFTEAGIPDMRLLDTPDGSKAVFGHLPAAPGSPTVLLYSHYDVQPPLDEAAWTTPVWTLTERGDGRWYGRGAADCKGNIVMQLTALRALGDLSRPASASSSSRRAPRSRAPAAWRRWSASTPKLLRADTVLVCDTGNSAVGVPTATIDLRGVVHAIVSVRSLAGPVHSGSFGGPAPDALAALIAMLATLHDADGNTTVNGLDNERALAGRGLSRRAVPRATSGCATAFA